MKLITLSSPIAVSVNGQVQMTSVVVGYLGQPLNGYKDADLEVKKVIGLNGKPDVTLAEPIQVRIKLNNVRSEQEVAS